MTIQTWAVFQSVAPAVLGPDGIHRIDYGSVSEQVDTAFGGGAQSAENADKIDARQFDVQDQPEWVNYQTRQTIHEQLSVPNPELLEAIAEMRDMLTSDAIPPMKRARRIVRGLEDGESIDPERWIMDRRTDCWEEIRRVPRPARRVSIGVNISCSYRREQPELLYRGAAALALADYLAAAGYSTEIVGFMATSNPTDWVDQLVTRTLLKASNMPMDVGALALCCCDIGYFRLVGIYGRTRHLPGTIHPTYGRTEAMLPAADRAGLDYLIDSDVLSREAAENWLKTALTPLQ